MRFHNKYFHTFDHICEYDLNFTNNTNNKTVNFIISDEIMGMYELNKKLTIARQKGYIFKTKIFSNLSYINIHYHLRLGAPPLHRQFFIKISQNHDCIQTHCNDRRNPFHFACRQWYSNNNPNIIT